MEIEKFYNLSEVELALEERKAAEQLFRLRFQMRMGQNDGLEKLRALKKDVARIKTVARQRELGIVPVHAGTAEGNAETKKTVRAKKATKAKKTAESKTVKAAAETAAKPEKASKSTKTKTGAAKSKAKKETR
ncbi:MAG TPA: 50S ribosomal protein L29 [Acidobacteriaceae bacterium]|jgi:large subunit ribosomal protein L29|nr:50S ribosomal protein L29 [Acidobacteriaceae bacterium]